VLNLTTWSTLHMAACMIFYTYHYMANQGYQEAVSVFEAIFLQFQWVVPTYYLFMYPFFIYYFWLVIIERTLLKIFMAVFNVVLLSLILSCMIPLLPKNEFYMALKGSKGNLSLFIHFFVLYICLCVVSSPKESQKK